MSRSFFAAAIFFAAAVCFAGEFTANGCFAKWDASSLEIGNGLFMRRYQAHGDRLDTVSFRSPEGQEWIVPRKNGAAPAGFEVSCSVGKWSPAGTEGIVAKVRTGSSVTTLHVFPTAPGPLVTRNPARLIPEPALTPAQTNSVYRRCISRGWALFGAAASVSDALLFAPKHLKATAYELLDQTDVRNELVFTREWLFHACELATELSCASLDVRDTFTGDGLVFLRLAPMPSSRPSQAPDFLLDAGRGAVVPLANGFPVAELVYAGGERGRIAALQAFQRALRPYRPGRDGVFLSNTWGDGNGDSRINEAFLRREIDAGAKIGVDVIQIDDGWQRGRTANSRKAMLGNTKKVWNGYWATDPHYWDPDVERFPNGVKPLVEAARAKGMKFGLWFGPDSSDDAANWRRDADFLLNCYRDWGVPYFKIDSMKLYTPLAFERNRRFFDRMLELSGAEMVFDLDCTAEIRPGYLGLMDIGPLFVENRYARRGRQYWPHMTLRTLWSLAQVVDPVRLRLELLNPTKLAAEWGEDPLAPQKWPADALFAAVMFASPLGWMELSDVPPGIVAQWAPLVAAWKRERARLHGGVIQPAASKPDGVAWTGFVSAAADGKGGYAVLFREMNEEAKFELDLGTFFETASFRSVRMLGGRGTAKLEDDGSELEVQVPAKLDFVWVAFG